LEGGSLKFSEFGSIDLRFEQRQYHSGGSQLAYRQKLDCSMQDLVEL